MLTYTFTHERHEDAAEATTAEAVDDEVERRVGDDQQVADAYVEEVRVRADGGNNNNNNAFPRLCKEEMRGFFPQHHGNRANCRSTIILYV